MNEEQAADRLTELVMLRLGARSSSEVRCPREGSMMTPCVARDGHLATADDGVCVGCGELPTELLAALEE